MSLNLKHSNPTELVVAQRAALLQHAADSGDHSLLLYFLWACGDLEAIRAVHCSRADEVALTTLALGDRAASRRELPALLPELTHPWLLYCVARYWLAQDAPMRAVQCATRSLQQFPHYSPALLLVARDTLARGDWDLANELLTQAERLGPQQRDVQAWRAADIAVIQSWQRPLNYAQPPVIDAGFYLPVYNAADTLEPVMEGVLRQALPLREFFVVDDGSSDSSPAIAKRYATTLISHPENLGLAAARNTALHHSRSTFLGSCDSDAVLDPEYLVYMAIECELGGPHLAALGGRMEEYHTDTLADAWRSVHLTQDTGLQRRSSWKEPPGLPVENSPTYLPGCNMVLRRDAALAVGGFDPRHRTNGEDGDMGRKLHAAGHVLVTSPLAHCYHLRRDTPLSVLRTNWSYNEEPFRAMGAFESVERVIQLFGENQRWAMEKVRHDLATGNPAFLYMDILYVLVCHLLDAAHVVRLGKASAGARQWMGTTLFAWIADRVAQHSPDLAGRLLADLEPLRPRTGAPLEPPTDKDRDSYLRTLRDIENWIADLLPDLYPALDEAR